MNRDTWDLVKNSKAFDVAMFRHGLVALIISLGLSCIFGLLLFYTYISEPERSYYATDGITPPVKLTALSGPNLSARALLESDPPRDPEERAIPQ